MGMTKEEAKKFLANISPLLSARMREAIKALEQELTTRNCFGCKYSKDNHNAGTEECHLCMWENQYTPTTKNDLGVDCIDRAELLKAMDTWDKFGYTETGCFVRAPKNDYVPYVHYEDMVYCVKGMPSVTLQEPKTGHWEQYGNSWEDKFKCSECGKEQPKILCGERIIGHWSDYCPNCGAKMVEPQESEET